MANLKQLKLKRQSVNKTRKVTKAMEAVSAVKMRKAQEYALAGRAFATVALRILDALSNDIESLDHPFLSARPEAKKYGLLLISSDKGLAGSLNSSVLKKAQEFIDGKGVDDIVAIAIGRRAKEFLKSKGINIIYYQENKKDAVSLDDTLKISRIIKQQQLSFETKSWTIAYMNFISTFEQKPELKRALPLVESELFELVEDIAPRKGKYEEYRINKEDIKAKWAYTFEAESKDIIDDLVFELLNVVIHHALLESKASEHSARMVAMKAATDKAADMSRDLLLKFNKARQAAITREVSEITSGVEAMKS